MKNFTIKEVCPSCKGTGLYEGMGERDGFAVQCGNCKGTGCFQFSHDYEDFETRKEKKGVTIVLQTNPGICVGGDGNFGGMPYKDWKQGIPFPPKSEMRGYTCPAWWCQSACSDKRPDWKECGWGVFSQCKHFPCKEQCWQRWDKENL